MKNKNLVIWKIINGKSIEYKLLDGYKEIGTISLIIAHVYNNYIDENIYKYIEEHLGKKRDKLIYISGLSVLKEDRGKGYGRSLLRHALNEFKGYVAMLHAQTMDYDTMNNESLCNFYKSEGFEFAPFDGKSMRLMINNND